MSSARVVPPCPCWRTVLLESVWSRQWLRCCGAAFLRTVVGQFRTVVGQFRTVVGQFFGLGRIVVLLRRVVSSGQPLPPKTHCVNDGLWQFQVLPRTVDALAVRLKQFQVLLRTMDAFAAQTCTKMLGSVEVVCFLSCRLRFSYTLLDVKWFACRHEDE